MKFSIQRETLLKPLQTIVGVVERRQTLPVLSNILVGVSNDKLSMTATDLEVEMIATVPVISLSQPVRLLIFVVPFQREQKFRFL